MAYVTSEQLQSELEILADELGISVAEALAVVTGRIDTNDGLISSIQEAVSTNATAIEAITEMSDNGVESIAEKIAALNSMFTEDGNLATDVLNRIATNATAIGANATEIAALKTADTNIQASISALTDRVANNETSVSNLNTTVQSNKAASENKFIEVNEKLDSIDGELDVLAGDDTVVGSIAKSIKDAVEVEKQRAMTRENTIEVKADEALSRIGDIESELDDVVDGQGNVTAKGLRNKIADNADAIVAEAQSRASDVANLQSQIDASQGSGLEVGIICGKKSANKFRARLSQAPIVENCGNTDEGL